MLSLTRQENILCYIIYFIRLQNVGHYLLILPSLKPKQLDMYLI